MTDANRSLPEPGPDASVHDIRADIDATRGELGATVEALSTKLDVKQQAKQKVEDTKDLIADKAQTVRSKGSEVGSQVVGVTTDDDGAVRPMVPVAAVAVIAVIVGVVIWKRRHLTLNPIDQTQKGASWRSRDPVRRRRFCTGQLA